MLVNLTPSQLSDTFSELGLQSVASGNATQTAGDRNQMNTPVITVSKATKKTCCLLMRVIKIRSEATVMLIPNHFKKTAGKQRRLLTEHRVWESRIWAFM